MAIQPLAGFFPLFCHRDIAEGDRNDPILCIVFKE